TRSPRTSPHPAITASTGSRPTIRILFRIPVALLENHLTRLYVDRGPQVRSAAGTAVWVARFHAEPRRSGAAAGSDCEIDDTSALRPAIGEPTRCGAGFPVR